MFIKNAKAEKRSSHHNDITFISICKIKIHPKKIQNLLFKALNKASGLTK